METITFFNGIENETVKGKLTRLGNTLNYVLTTIEGWEWNIHKSDLVDQIIDIKVTELRYTSVGTKRNNEHVRRYNQYTGKIETFNCVDGRATWVKLREDSLGYFYIDSKYSNSSARVRLEINW